MKPENPILRNLLLTCNIICFYLAFHYTYLQIKIYFDNEDVSSISYVRFENGNEDKYPTYSICFEDSFIRQMYRTQNLQTGCSTYSGCKSGQMVWYAKVENGMIVLWDEKYSGPSMDQTMEDEKDSGNSMLPSMGIPMGMPSMGLPLRKKRSNAMFVVNEGGAFYLKGEYGSDIIKLSNEHKTFIIAPEQYQQLLMGVNQSLHYHMEGPNKKNEDAVDFNYKLNDLTRFDFNATIIDLDDFLFRYEVKDLKGMIYGWHTEEYKTIEGFCETSILDRWPEAMQFLQNKQDCNVANSFLQSLEKMENLTYPFEKNVPRSIKSVLQSKTRYQWVNKDGTNYIGFAKNVFSRR